MRRISANFERPVWQCWFVRRALPSLAAAACLAAPEFAVAQSGWKWFGAKPVEQVQAPKPQNGFAASVQRLMEQARQEAAAGNTQAALQTAQRAHKIAEAASSVLGSDPMCSPDVTRKFVADIATLNQGNSAATLVQAPPSVPAQIALEQRLAAPLRPAAAPIAAPRPQAPSIVSAPPAVPQVVESAPIPTAPESRSLPAFVSRPQPVVALLPPTSAGAEVPSAADRAPLQKTPMAASPRATRTDPYSVSARIQPYLSLPEFSIVGGTAMTDVSEEPAAPPVELTVEFPQVPPVRDYPLTSAAPARRTIGSPEARSTFLTETLSIVSADEEDSLANDPEEPAFAAPPVPGVDGPDDALSQPISEFAAMEIISGGETQLTSQSSAVAADPIDTALLQDFQSPPKAERAAEASAAEVTSKRVPSLPTEIPWDSNATEWSSGGNATTTPGRPSSRWVDSAWQPKRNADAPATESQAVPLVPPVRTSSKSESPASQPAAAIASVLTQSPVVESVSPVEVADLGVVTTAFVVANAPSAHVPTLETAPAVATETAPAPPAESDEEWTVAQPAWMRSVPAALPEGAQSVAREDSAPFNIVQLLARLWNVPTHTVATLLGGGGLLLLGCGMMLARAIRRPGA
ncbi:MAG: hypothetical protein SFV23_06460 [Planctomycetaceae bacterium]|nr:hypothetical protein [Planctomycetaceae bacterium]